MARFTVACVLRASKTYDVDYVERLQAGVEKHLPGAPFVCLSDVKVPCGRITLKADWPGWWAKTELCAPWVKGDLLSFDLDTMIVGSLSDLANVGRLTMLSDFNVPALLQSGVMFLPEGERLAAWARWIADPRGHIERYRGLGDGGFFAEVWGDRAVRWQDLLPGQLVSYKRHVRQAKDAHESGDGTVPEGARAVCFHGAPKPRDIGWTL